MNECKTKLNRRARKQEKKKDVHIHDTRLRAHAHEGSLRHIVGQTAETQAAAVMMKMIALRHHGPTISFEFEMTLATWRICFWYLPADQVLHQQLEPVPSVPFLRDICSSEYEVSWGTVYAWI